MLLSGGVVAGTSKAKRQRFRRSWLGYHGAPNPNPELLKLNRSGLHPEWASLCLQRPQNPKRNERVKGDPKHRVKKNPWITEYTFESYYRIPLSSKAKVDSSV